MPSVTKKQARFFALCAHSPGKVRGKCPPKAVAKEFNRADARRKRIAAVAP